METIGDQRAFVSSAAAEIDRIVVRGHERADAYRDKPAAVTELTAFPHLLSFAAIVLLHRPLGRDDVARIVPFTPPSIVDALVDNNVSEGVVTERDGELALTDLGRKAAEGVVTVQEQASAEMWASVPDTVGTVERLVAPVVQHGQAVGPPIVPSNFTLFAEVCERPLREARTLRLLTAVRYWRADAHRRALADADLRPFEAHALNRLWDAHRQLDRVGQGFPEPGRKGVAALEVRGLADGGVITADGVKIREQVERDTDVLSAPIYDPLDAQSQAELLAALRTVPT